LEPSLVLTHRSLFSGQRPGVFCPTVVRHSAPVHHKDVTSRSTVCQQARLLGQDCLALSEHLRILTAQRRRNTPCELHWDMSASAPTSRPTAAWDSKPSASASGPTAR